MEADQKQLRAWVHLALIPSLGPRRLIGLLLKVGYPQRVLQLEGRDLELLGLPPRTAGKIVAEREAAEPDTEMERARALGVHLIPLGSSRYPQGLLELVDPPPLLYVRGEIPDGCPLYALAIVGARACSAYGRSQARLFAGKLARSGIAVVSGLARGVDAAAHQGALECGGWTVGVLGCGIDLEYPPVNRWLYREIGARGALVSEFPLGTTPQKMNFPRRNRIIAALSAGVLVVEARKKSGTLITVDHALELGKEIYCLPGAVTSPLSTGTHDLIRQGATLVTRPDEILAVHDGWAVTETDEAEELGDLSPEETKVLGALRASPVGLDDLGRMAGLGPADTSRAVTLLEVAGRIVRGAGGTFQAVR